MKRSGTQSIGRFLHGIKASGGQSLTRFLTAHAEWEKRLLNRLPLPLREHCRAGQIRDNTLILFVDSPAWATRLRFMSGQILSQLATSDSVTATKLEVRILPQNMPGAPAAPRAEANRLSDENAALITSLARNVNDEKLSQALAQLASRRKTKSP